MTEKEAKEYIIDFINQNAGLPPEEVARKLFEEELPSHPQGKTILEWMVVTVLTRLTETH